MTDDRRHGTGPEQPDRPGEGAGREALSRRRFLSLAAGAAGAGLGLGALAGCRPPGSPAASVPDDRPDVLMIAIDDLNDWVGCLGGHPDTVTPRIDSLAASGIVFANAHCAGPLCGSSRTAILTGLAPVTSGIFSNDQNYRTHWPNLVTLPACFRAGGYDALGVGKIFHEPEHGLGEFSNYRKVPHPEHGAPGMERLNGLPELDRELDWGALDLPPEEFGDRRGIDWALEQLARPRERPLFLAVGISEPHLPWYLPAGSFERFPPQNVRLPEVLEDDRLDLPPPALRLLHSHDHFAILRAGAWHAAVAAYLAAVHYVDSLVGRLIDGLAASGRAEQTLVVLWSDHGFHLGEKEQWRKFTLWEEATRVPLILAGPGVGAPGGRCERPASLLDLYKTLVELCAVEPPPHPLEGESLVPLLVDPRAERAAPAITSLKPLVHAVRSETMRYIRYGPLGEELYDHTVDPNEWTNLADDPRYAEVKKELREWIQRTPPLALKRRRLRLRRVNEKAAANRAVRPESSD